MTDRQSNYLDMYGVVLTLYTANQAVIDAVAARATAFGAFQNNVTAINTNVANQSLVVMGVSADKAQARATLNGLSQVIFGLARTWALAVDDLTSAGEFDFSLSEIGRVKDDSIIPFLEHRLAIVNGNLPALADYGITPALVTQWEDAISDYGSVVSAPRSAIVSRSTSTAQLRQLFNTVQRLLRDTIDPLMLPFKGSDPELFTQYRKARIIIDRRGPRPGDGPGPTATAFFGHVTDTFGNTLAGATVRLSNAEGTVETQTDSNGNYRLELTGLEEPVSAHLSAETMGMMPSSRPVTIAPDEQQEQNFMLSPMAPPPAP